MPIKAGRGKKSRSNVHEADYTLKGWEFIQETLLSHDEDMVADYADDIDTLLVFAGLFSAVLTAFLAVSIVLLQPDNSQLSVQLLSLIALQNGAPSNMEPFLNATAASLPNSTTFHAPTNIVTMNALWLTSLVLSLATALFGILAKQWCREYLRWYSAIATARQNILVRQLRFEAWQRWRVPSCIAFIPALLEIALVLFLVGLLILVPTFSDRSLTMVVSVVIASALFAAVALTLLPFFSRSCPFQSPTGWTIVRLAGLLRTTFWWFTWRIAFVVHSSILIIAGYNRRPGLWQTLEVHSWLKLLKAERLPNWRIYTLSLATNPRFCKAAVRGIDAASKEMNISPDQLSVDARQNRILVNALSWVSRGSYDERVRVEISACIQSIHISPRGKHPIISELQSILSALHVICPTDLLNAYGFVRWFYIWDTTLSFRSSSPLTLVCRNGPYLIVAYCQEIQREHGAARTAWERNSASLEVCHAAARHDILSLVDDWLSVMTDDPIRQLVAKRIAFLFCLMRLIPSVGAERCVYNLGRTLTRPWAEMLQEFHRKLAPYKLAYSDGLIPMCVELCQFLGPVNFKCEQNVLRIIVADDLPYTPGRTSPDNSDCNRVSTWATLALNVYRNSQDYDEGNQRHLFVTAVSHVFETSRLRIAECKSVIANESTESVTPLAQLLSAMMHAIRWSLSHSQPDCGAYIPLPWIRGMRQCYEARDGPLAPLYYWGGPPNIAFTDDLTLRPTFLRILRLLKISLDRRLLTGAEAATDFDGLMALLGNPELPEEPVDSWQPPSQLRSPSPSDVFSQSESVAPLFPIPSGPPHRFSNDIEEPSLECSPIPAFPSADTPAYPEISTSLVLTSSSSVPRQGSERSFKAASIDSLSQVESWHLNKCPGEPSESHLAQAGVALVGPPSTTGNKRCGPISELCSEPRANASTRSGATRDYEVIAIRPSNDMGSEDSLPPEPLDLRDIGDGDVPTSNGPVMYSAESGTGRGAHESGLVVEIESDRDSDLEAGLRIPSPSETV